MADPLLREVDEFIDEMNFKRDEDDLRNAVLTALRSATQKSASAVRTDFLRATVVDTFFVRRSMDFGIVGRSRTGDARFGDGRVLRGFGASETAFMLSQGFVDSAQTITVFGAQRHQALPLADERTDLTSPDNFTLFQYDEGIMRVLDFGLHNSYVQVSYTAGFTVEDGDPPVFQSVPLWLREICTLKTQMLLNNNPVVREQPLPAEIVSEIKGQVDEVIQDHARYLPQVNRPIGTTITLI